MAFSKQSRIALTVLFAAFLFSPPGRSAPPAIGNTPITRAPVIAPAAAVVAPHSPALGYPANNALYETASPVVNIYVSWTFAFDVGAIHSFEICYFKAGQSCGPISESHFGLNTAQRTATLSVPPQPGQWEWQIGACPSNKPCIWSETRTVSVVPKLAAPEPLAPAAGVTETLPGNLQFTWKDVPGAQFYRVCDQDASQTLSWQCPTFPTTNFAYELTLTQVPKPIFLKTVGVNDVYNFTGPTPTRQRAWAAEACHVVQERVGTAPPADAIHCTRGAMRRYTASKAP